MATTLLSAANVQAVIILIGQPQDSPLTALLRVGYPVSDRIISALSTWDIYNLFRADKSFQHWLHVNQNPYRPVKKLLNPCARPTERVAQWSRFAPFLDNLESLECLELHRGPQTAPAARCLREANAAVAASVVAEIPSTATGVPWLASEVLIPKPWSRCAGLPMSNSAKLSIPAAHNPNLICNGCIRQTTLSIAETERQRSRIPGSIRLRSDASRAELCHSCAMAARRENAGLVNPPASEADTAVSDCKCKALVHDLLGQVRCFQCRWAVLDWQLQTIHASNDRLQRAQRRRNPRTGQMEAMWSRHWPLSQTSNCRCGRNITAANQQLNQSVRALRNGVMETTVVTAVPLFFCKICLKTVRTHDPADQTVLRRSARLRRKGEEFQIQEVE